MVDNLEITEPRIISYMNLRRAVGYIGIGIPIVLYFGAKFIFGVGLQPSLSAYYHTEMGDVLVGMLVAIGFFLYSYRGYDRKDDLAGDLACLFAIGTAILPIDGGCACAPNVSGGFHLIFAAMFFLTLIYFSYFLFTKTDPARDPTPIKLSRNKIYKACAYIMSICIILIAIHDIVMSETSIERLKPVFWLESILVWAFGLAWITKGQAILSDEQ